MYPAPIGVFDSGIGGISVLRALLAALPEERFVYAGDSAHAPYGERGDEYVTARSQAVLEGMRRTHGIKAYVIACNTATAAAGRVLRDQHTDLPIIGIEPALKPGALATRTGRVAVLATHGTLSSEKFRVLRERLSGPVEFIPHACTGLASAIEKEASSGIQTHTDALLDQHLSALGPLGTEPGQIDTVVLGCTHYPLIVSRIQQRTGPTVQLIDPGEAVARHTRDLLAAHGLLATTQAPSLSLELLDSGDGQALSAAASRWLDGVASLTKVQAFATA
ncbi:glutamate racemase [Ottowia thiooxydans]|uniref:glutamate racemase n=1 Tax=Ottowia thiooxydans TaxID=219182 RepID=UPI000418854D|nr:glutamate racemase [Ottowia thiooxydans]